MHSYPIRSAAGLATTLFLGVAVPGNATVTDVATNGFTLKIEAHVAAAPDKVFAALIKPERWWASDHTFSGKAENLHLDAKVGGCWCETLPNGGSTMHMTVVFVSPGKTLRLRGPLGPFQGLGVDGALTFSLKPGGDGTDLTAVYALGGYNKDGFEKLSQAADGVLTTQVERLKKSVETGNP
jgi:uncharacterized protein YndB with AHSA1/START domain